VLEIIPIVLLFVRNCVRSRAGLTAENLALRQQLIVYQRTSKRPRLKPRDRIFWVGLTKLWSGWKSALVIVKPETVCRWHRQGFRLYWLRKSRSRGGRPKVAMEVRQLIRQMSQDNVTWGAPRIRDELRMLGYKFAESTVAKYMIKRRGNPSPSWKVFLKNHANDRVACDFFTVPTVNFRLFYCFVVLHHATRRVLHFKVTTNPTAQWTAQQLNETFPFDSAPKYLIRDNDKIYGKVFQQRVKSLGMKDVRTAYRSPWQNGYCERVIGSIRRECLDHVIVLSEAHLMRVLKDYFEYYNKHRVHQGLGEDTPSGRNKEPPEQGEVIAIPYLDGLHHRYCRHAA